MELAPVSLILADISGYTRFVRMHKISLLHAEEIVTELMEAVLSRVEEPLILNKLEGDAAFVYARMTANPDEARLIMDMVMGFFAAFRSRQQELIKAGEGGCFCAACCNIGSLKLKAIVHYGQAVIKQVRQLEELGGVDVILAHRLLKNNLQAQEYLLLTDAFCRARGEVPDQASVEYRQSFDIGEVRGRVYFPEAPPLDIPQTKRFTRMSGVLAGLQLFPKTFWRRLSGPRVFHNLPD